MTVRKPLSIYIHWGFCSSKCPYCDFASQKIPLDIDFSIWLKEYKRAIDFFIPFIEDYEVQSIFFGGGTPSLLPSYFIEELIKYISKYFHLRLNLEITLEANPSSSEAKKFRELRDIGVNRLSLGIQSLSDISLKFLGRLHTKEEGLEALKQGLKIFSNVSFDLIYALPEQSIKEWSKELSEALSYQSPHLSLYQLSIEEGSEFFRRKIETPKEELAARLYERTWEITTKAGLAAYEVSNHALSGYESIHNLSYWRYQDYLGIGPSAHGRFSINGKKHAFKQEKNPFIWLKLRNKNSEDIILTSQEIMEERAIMGLRTTEGVLSKYLPQKHLSSLLSEGLLEQRGPNICASQKGFLLIDLILSRLFSD